MSMTWILGLLFNRWTFLILAILIVVALVGLKKAVIRSDGSVTLRRSA